MKLVFRLLSAAWLFGASASALASLVPSVDHTVGSGTASIYFVLDWNDGATDNINWQLDYSPGAYVNVYEAMQDLEVLEPNLSFVFQDFGIGAYVDGMAYDNGSEMHSVVTSTSPAPRDWLSVWEGDATGSSWSSPLVGISDLAVTDGYAYGLNLEADWNNPATAPNAIPEPSVAVALLTGCVLLVWVQTSSKLIGLALLATGLGLRAQDPWATTVVSYAQGSAPAAGYTVPEVALGRPTVMTYANDTELTPSVVVVPVYPPWEVDQIVSIGEGGSLVLQLGQAVTNDPENPYGVDVLVFGNALLSGAGLYDQLSNDPRTYTLSATPTVGTKWGVVSVSADGVTWFDFPAEQRVGSLMPTLGKRWTGTAWGAETDPTIPPDPDLTAADLAGMNLADLCVRFRGGAGGTGFDLSDLIVPEGQTLPASFTFVKISVPDDGDTLTNHRTEIDAVTVVAPVDGFTRWQQDSFGWTGDPAQEAADANGDGDAFDNWQEYARGGNPEEQETSLPLPEMQVEGEGFTLELATSASEAPWRVQGTATPGDESSWETLDPQPEAVDTPTTGGVTRTYTFPALEGGMQLYRLYLEEAP